MPSPAEKFFRTFQIHSNPGTFGIIFKSYRQTWAEKFVKDEFLPQLEFRAGQTENHTVIPSFFCHTPPSPQFQSDPSFERAHQAESNEGSVSLLYSESWKKFDAWGCNEPCGPKLNTNGVPARFARWDAILNASRMLLGAYKMLLECF